MKYFERRFRPPKQGQARGGAKHAGGNFSKAPQSLEKPATSIVEVTVNTTQKTYDWLSAAKKS